MSNNYNAYTVQHYEGLGYCVFHVETGIQGSKYLKRDFLGFADYLSCKFDEMTAVQSTDHTHHASRKTKILSEPRAACWLLSGKTHRIELISWNDENGEKKVRIEQIGITDFPVTVLWEAADMMGIKLEDV